MKKITKIVGLAAIVTASYFTIDKSIEIFNRPNKYDNLYNRTLLLYGDIDGDGHISDAEKKQFPKDVFSYGNVHINKENMSYKQKIKMLENYNQKKEHKHNKIFNNFL